MTQDGHIWFIAVLCILPFYALYPLLQTSAQNISIPDIPHPPCYKENLETVKNAALSF